MKYPPLALIILDGFGFTNSHKFNAIAQAQTPTLDYVLKHYPHTTLEASGSAVGLLEKQIGNSEAGHMTIGAGRVIEQDITRITYAIENKSFFENKTLKNILLQAQKTQKLHIVGLVSDGGIHSHIMHLLALIQAALEKKIAQIFIHAILDGRDTPPKSAEQFLAIIELLCQKHTNLFITDICGRFYAMDRDKNWDRTEKYYALLTQKTHIQFHHWQEALTYCYTQEITDEFIPPIQLHHQGIINDQDPIIFFNVRPERMRQIVSKFNQANIATLINYHNDTKIPFFYEKVTVTHTLKEILSNHGKKIFTIAETEKYAHVTYFFDGQREITWPGETRILVPSIMTTTYKNYPRMSADHITQQVILSLKTDPQDFYLINYANADMVGHSGNIPATIKAIACLDEQLKILYDEIVKKRRGIAIITGDHGKAEDMFDREAQQPRTAHTHNPVYCIIAGNQKRYDIKKLSTIAHITPFILEYFGIE